MQCTSNTIQIIVYKCWPAFELLFESFILIYFFFTGYMFNILHYFKYFETMGWADSTSQLHHFLAMPFYVY